MRGFAARFLKDESGVTAAEYALIAALIAIGIIAAAKTVSAQIGAIFTTTKTTMKTA
jgi:pilus assembly protein Flp/PilA